MTLDKSLPRQLDEHVIAIGDFETSEQVLVYRSDPEKLGESALQQFYRDLIFGRPLPIKLVAREIQDIDEALIVALFLDRKLAIAPTASTVVFACDLGRFGPAGLAHVDRDFAEFITWARLYLGDNSGGSSHGERVRHVVEWLQRYILEGVLPSGPVSITESGLPRVLDLGTNGFVVAGVGWGSDLPYAWTELYRQGHLRGALFEQEIEGRRRVLVARKSPLVALDLEKASAILNEAEKAMGEAPGWAVEASLWLWGPEEGTLLLPTDIVQILVRL